MDVLSCRLLTIPYIDRSHRCASSWLRWWSRESAIVQSCHWWTLGRLLGHGAEGGLESGVCSLCRMPTGTIHIDLRLLYTFMSISDHPWCAQYFQITILSRSVPTIYNKIQAWTMFHIKPLAPNIHACLRLSHLNTHTATYVSYVHPHFWIQSPPLSSWRLI